MPNENEITTAQGPSVVETSSVVLAAQAKALVEARYTVALARPRDWDSVRERLLKDCRRPGFANSAIYHKPIGKGVEGPSIRFAEAAIRNMTNITVETATIFDDHERRIVRVSVTDLEANVPYSQDVTITKTVERNSIKPGETPIRTRIGSRDQKIYVVEATDDDILNKANALVSKAVRTLGLRLLPGDIQDECMSVCKATQRDQDAKDPEAAKRQLFDAFGRVGMTVDQLKAYLGTDARTLTAKEMETLRALYNSLKDGETTVREIMDGVKEPKKNDDLAAAAAAAAASRKDLAA